MHKIRLIGGSYDGEIVEKDVLTPDILVRLHPKVPAWLSARTRAAIAFSDMPEEMYKKMELVTPTKKGNVDYCYVYIHQDMSFSGAIKKLIENYNP